MPKKKNRKKRKRDLEQADGQLLPDREAMSVVTTGPLGPAPVDGVDSVVPPGRGSPLDPDLYESGDNT